MISIKEVTKETGITVRTLRHYDHIGLLPPAAKTEGGHRLYGEVELQKLQEIQFLKTLGFSLKEIKDMLSNNDWDWAECLRNQLTFISQEKEKLAQIESTLRGLLNGLTMDGQIDLIKIQKLIQLYQKNKDKREIYRNQMFQEKETALLDLLPNVNSGDPDSLEWVSLLGQLKQHKDEGAGSIRIQRIIRRMYEKQEETFGNNNDAFLDKFWEIRKSPKKSQDAGFYPIEPEILKFLEEASEIYVSNRRDVHHQ
ncbi:MerR family transcriptional regulator [Pueribacillus theae]|uniref:MerR family transcriptional regulator n=1 Tax=Pueribacillus theae TaxID=2171751 RepID=A0A2U1JRD6_9BACI|nr:MerR family transcriptional regulator [Pueribacillus theae]PWA07524.1 MerR family transcriptional regulator [Pueribacillus theae]